MLKLISFILLASLALACTDPNCISCVTDPTYCKTCRPGYRATLGKCDPCDEAHCANCNESESYCSSCLDGYHANGGHCYPCPQDHCAKCPLGNTCTACLDGYKLTINGCVARAISRGNILMV